jgi:hypothetical protein
MATNRDDINAIRVYFLNTWNEVPVIFDNEPAIDEPEGIWARLSVNPGASKRASIARKTYDQQGRVYLQVMIPEGEPDNEGWTLAERFGMAFRELNLDNYRVRFDTPEYSSSDAEDDWYVITVSIPYTAKH